MFSYLLSRASTSASARDRASASARHRSLPYHHISQSFDLPPATTSVSHLTCPLPPHHQSELALALEIELVLVLEIELVLDRALPCHCISQSFDLPPATMSVSHLTCPLPPHQSFDLLSTTVTAILHYHIGQSFDLPPPPHQSVI